jgi:predicted  nucleic acid-binding Zn-ribbon protein
MRKNSTTERELATHTAEIKHLQADMDKLVEDMKQVKECLVEIQKTLAEAKGGWKMTMLIGGAGATIGGWIVHWFKG